MCFVHYSVFSRTLQPSAPVCRRSPCVPTGGAAAYGTPLHAHGDDVWCPSTIQDACSCTSAELPQPSTCRGTGATAGPGKLFTLVFSEIKESSNHQCTSPDQYSGKFKSRFQIVGWRLYVCHLILLFNRICDHLQTGFW